MVCRLITIIQLAVNFNNELTFIRQMDGYDNQLIDKLVSNEKFNPAL